MKTLLTLAMLALCGIALPTPAHAQGITQYGIAFYLDASLIVEQNSQSGDTLTEFCNQYIPGSVDMSQELNGGYPLVCVCPWSMGLNWSALLYAIPGYAEYQSIRDSFGSFAAYIQYLITSSQ